MNDFGQALHQLKDGHRVCRRGWNGKRMWLQLVQPYDFNTFPTTVFGISSPLYEYDLEPFIVMKTADDKVVPWLASQTDVLAEDWEVFE